jgi:hypothetical protein
VAEARGQFGNLERERQHFQVWKPFPSNGREDVTVDTGVCVTGT